MVIWTGRNLLFSVYSDLFLVVWPIGLLTWMDLLLSLEHESTASPEALLSDVKTWNHCVWVGMSRNGTRKKTTWRESRLEWEPSAENRDWYREKSGRKNLQWSSIDNSLIQRVEGMYCPDWLVYLKIHWRLPSVGRIRNARALLSSRQWYGRIMLFVRFQRPNYFPWPEGATVQQMKMGSELSNAAGVRRTRNDLQQVNMGIIGVCCFSSSLLPGNKEHQIWKRSLQYLPTEEREWRTNGKDEHKFILIHLIPTDKNLASKKKALMPKGQRAENILCMMEKCWNRTKVSSPIIWGSS